MRTLLPRTGRRMLLASAAVIALAAASIAIAGPGSPASTSLVSATFYTNALGKNHTETCTPTSGDTYTMFDGSFTGRRLECGSASHRADHRSSEKRLRHDEERRVAQGRHPDRQPDDPARSLPRRADCRERERRRPGLAERESRRRLPPHGQLQRHLLDGHRLQLFRDACDLRLRHRHQHGNRRTVALRPRQAASEPAAREPAAWERAEARRQGRAGSPPLAQAERWVASATRRGEKEGTPATASLSLTATGRGTAQPWRLVPRGRAVDRARRVVRRSRLDRRGHIRPGVWPRHRPGDRRANRGRGAGRPAGTHRSGSRPTTRPPASATCWPSTAWARTGLPSPAAARASAREPGSRGPWTSSAAAAAVRTIPAPTSPRRGISRIRSERAAG